MRCAFKNWQIFQIGLAKAICKDSNLTRKVICGEFHCYTMYVCCLYLYTCILHMSMYAIHILIILRLRF